MKVLPFKIPKAQNIGLIYQEDKEPYFYDKLHQHEEIQLSCIVKGEGTFIIGDAISTYKSGDILVIGSNIPHVFKSDTTNIDESFMVSLFFTKDSFGKNFFSLDDFKELNSFFKKSVNGFRVLSYKEQIQQRFLSLQKATNLERFVGLFDVLLLIKRSKVETLASFVNSKKYSDNEGKRMRDVIDFTINNYHLDIDLERIAGIATMTPNAFCKYFKQRTNKTYFSFLNELRIENTCKLLAENNDLSISEIAYQSGFKNLSNFNRKFKEIKGTTPFKYKKSTS